jgi:hypothetical protein
MKIPDHRHRGEEQQDFAPVQRQQENEEVHGQIAD